MCGRYSLSKMPRKLVDEYGPIDQFRPRYNIAPTQLAAVIEKTRKFRAVSWGLKLNLGTHSKTLINARSETVTTKRAFKNLWQTSRCLVPADGYYEWQVSDKKPFRIWPTDDEPFCFAGLMQTEKEGGQTERDCFCLLTSAAEGKLSALHHRKPVIIPSHLAKEWLMGEFAESSHFENFLRSLPSVDFQWQEVNPAVNHH